MIGSGQPAPAPPAAPARLADLVGDVDTFARHHWGRRPRLQRGAGGPAGVAGEGVAGEGVCGGGAGPDLARLLTIADVDRWLASAPRRPTVRLVRGGETIDPATYCSPVRLGGQAMTDVIDPAKVTAAYLAGATVVLQSLHRTWRPVGELVAGLAAELSHPVQANAYLTPPGAQGLSPHEDRHDVLVVQCHGTKRWTVDGLEDGGPDLELSAGDVLYLPAGTRHQAATNDRPSLHLTLGVIPDTVRSVVARLLDTEPALDQRLPLGYRRLPADDLVPCLARAVDDTRWALAAADAAALADELLLRRPAPTVPEATLGAVVAAAALGLDAWLVCRCPAECTVRGAGEDQLLVAYRGGVLRMPERLGPALAVVLSGAPVALRDLPGIDDDESRLVIARRLVAEGLVTLAPTPTP